MGSHGVAIVYALKFIFSPSTAIYSDNEQTRVSVSYQEIGTVYYKDEVECLMDAAENHESIAKGIRARIRQLAKR